MVTPNERPSLEQIRSQAVAGAIRVTQHAHAEMVDESFSLDDVIDALKSESAEVLEDYPTHRRGACCLVNGETAAGRPLHVVCTTAQPVLIIITVYEPLPPKWVTPSQRGR
jgi:hypothetical protein